ncbi:MAG: adenylate kinase [Bacteroidetes bacterium]|jgi:adenylate kinase|nr:adenylate kinase [Bacteroidota bacterium]
MKLILFGPPGAGKGTQADKIKSHYNIAHLATGNIFRRNIKNKTNLGQKVKSILDAGKLVPDETVVDLVIDELQHQKYESGYILDGFPRTIPQAEALDDYLSSKDTSIDLFVNLEVPEQELINRILSRADGRSDDTPEKIKTRLDVYHKQTAPVLNHYKKQGKVKEISGVGSIDEIFERIKEVLDQVK